MQAKIDHPAREPAPIQISSADCEFYGRHQPFQEVRRLVVAFCGSWARLTFPSLTFDQFLAHSSSGICSSGEHASG